MKSLKLSIETYWTGEIKIRLLVNHPILQFANLSSFGLQLSSIVKDVGSTSILTLPIQNCCRIQNMMHSNIET